MPNVTFKAKIRTVYNMDETPAWRDVKVPKLARAHCDIAAFRVHPKYGAYANSDLFPTMLARAVKSIGIGEYIRLDKIPAGVSIDASGFLAHVTISI